jgi:integrase
VGGKRGERKPGKAKLSPLTINWQLRAMKTMLNDMRLRGVVPLTRDAIADCLKLTNVPREAAEFLRQADCARALEAALRHDAATFAATREEHAGLRPSGSTPRYEPIAPFVAFVLLTGMRRSEALGMQWNYLDLDTRDQDGNIVGEIRLPADATKNQIARTIGFDVSPSLRPLLAALKLRAGKVRPTAFVFGGNVAWTESLVAAARARLVTTYGAPQSFGWQILRSTSATFLCNAPSIFGAAAAFMSAKRLGHSVAVSEKHYAGQLGGISREARTLEAAMQIEAVMGRVVAAVGGAPSAVVLVPGPRGRQATSHQ